ncbi:MAG: carboxylating nicotinate-nucleotide diphosphorylase, partial [Nanoarchaeota archaeon]
MRESLALEFWDRSRNLDIDNKEYANYVNKIINETLQEDVSYGDVTTNSLINKNKNIKAVIIAKQDGIIAGIDEISSILKNKKIKFNKNKKDGDKIKNNGAILEIYGNARKILSYERTLLNILQRMSGIATMTYNTKKLIKNNCFISGTRKTLFNLIDKKAISVGGGLTHRLNLSDSMLIKDNHLKLLNDNIEKALILAAKKAKYTEIEVKNEKEALEAAETILILGSNNLFAIMFDNMKASIIKNTIKKINNRLNNYNKKIKNKRIVLFEASGNINEKNILEYSK